MGADCKGLNTVKLYGPPANIYDYFQESERAGCDESAAVMLIYSGCAKSKHISKDMKKYIKNKIACRLSLLMNLYIVAVISANHAAK